jgi:hypothetical protein
MFGRLDGTAPPEAVQMMKMSYFATLALAYVRHGDLTGAKERIAIALSAHCTDTAHPSLQIMNANALTTKAIIDLALWAEAPASIGLLAEADRALDDSKRIFSVHGQLGMKSESHHLGRYFGTRAFVDAALLESRQRDVPLDTLFENARRAHSPADRRPIFGQIAGKYCEAYAYFLSAELATGGFSTAAQRAIELGKEIIEVSEAAASLLIEHASALIAGSLMPSEEVLATILAVAPPVVQGQFHEWGRDDGSGCHSIEPYANPHR